MKPKTAPQMQRPRRSSRPSAMHRRRYSFDSGTSLEQNVFKTTSIEAKGALPIEYDDNGDPIPYTTTVNSATIGKSAIPVPKSDKLNLSKVRINAPINPPERTKKRMFNLPHCPVFYPTEEEWNLNPFEYMEHLSDDYNATNFGICKIVPPANWRPEFSIDSRNFRFRSRLQRLNTVTAASRVKTNYCRQLLRFHNQNGSFLSSNPHIERKPIDIYALKVDVARLGGYDHIERTNNWLSVAREQGFVKSKPRFISMAFKEAYEDYIQPYETFVSIFKERLESKKTEEINMSFDDSDTIKYRLNGETNNGGDQVMEDVKLEEGLGNALPRRLAMSSSPPPIDQPVIKAELNGSSIECSNCKQFDTPDRVVQCAECENHFHLDCLIYPLLKRPDVQDWFCDACLYGSGEYGFDEGEDHSLASFQARDEDFRKLWFETHPPKTKGRVAPNGVEQKLGNKIVSEDDIEKEFWRLVDSQDEIVETEYGADIHTTETGSAFPTPKTHPDSKYATSGWNLANMPGYDGSVLSYIKNDVSGMTVPWIYVGMMFSTFCWHNEDHYTYSVNYMHWGETKTWYGVPGKDHEKFEDAMRKSAPELFSQQPDLLLQLVTLGNPGQLKDAGVPIYACDQRPNEFVITFPRAFHCGFNHGFNFNEAVNFALPDWIPEGRACVEKYRSLKRNPIFSHDELLVTIINKGFDDSLWVYLKDAILDMVKDEVEHRKQFSSVTQGDIESVTKYVDEDDYQCSNCRAYTYLSQLYDRGTKKIYCHRHFKQFMENSAPHNRAMRIRYSDSELDGFRNAVLNHEQKNAEWINKARILLDANQTKSADLTDLKEHLKKSVGIPHRVHEYSRLKSFIKAIESWIDRANKFWIDWNDTQGTIIDSIDPLPNRLNNYGTLINLLTSPVRSRFDVRKYFPHVIQLEKLKSILDWAMVVSSKYNLDSTIDENNKVEYQNVLDILKDTNVRGIKESVPLYHLKRKFKWMSAVNNSTINGLKYTQEVDGLLQEAETLHIRDRDHWALALLHDKKDEGFDWRSKALKLCSHVAITPEQVQQLLDEVSVKDQNLVKDFHRLMNFTENVKHVLDNHNDTLSKDGYFLSEAKRELEFVKTYRFKVKNYKNFDILIKHYETFIKKMVDALKIDLVNFDMLKLEKQAQFLTKRLHRRVQERIVNDDIERMCLCRVEKDTGVDVLDCRTCGTSFHHGCLPYDHSGIQDDYFECLLCKPQGKLPDITDLPNFKELASIKKQMFEGHSEKLKIRTKQVLETKAMIDKCNSFNSDLYKLVVSDNLSTLRNTALTLIGVGIAFDGFDPQMITEKIQKLSNSDKKRKSDINIPLDDESGSTSNGLTGRTRRPKFLFREDPPILNRADDKGVVKHCICQKFQDRQNQMSTMVIGCDRCKNWFHVECVGGAQQLEKISGQKFNCPCCSLKFGRVFQYLPVIIQLEGDVGTNLFVDVNKTVKNLTQVVKFELEPGIIDASVIVLHMYRFVPGAIEPAVQSKLSQTPEDGIKRRKYETPPTLAPPTVPSPQVQSPQRRNVKVTGWQPDGANNDVGSVDIEITV
ncbi:hypothetical protein E3Q23_01435 [Wallemia mellicola]|uniref:[histone H3]-trimethyl-L-lysine(4) demethylase n=1 Tax=Wallemia mellicola TaxID=1708541 RepID=A0A4T0PPV2_9BASI|nr:hypothetical protein E3Q23_01435 [Wallemia mellicola]TIC13112.1 hypothetical protein E3Q14_01488 [Wallemia mellicola]TIC67533.1 hypothetical protein E3Q01_01285 [Wallemia mellicola]